MIVILEGPDGGGKTTLAHTLAERYSLDYHHEGPPPAGVNLLQHYGSLLQEARLSHRGMVFDRLALGERVYGPILRGEDRLGEEGYRVFRRLAQACGALTVLCQPDWDTCYKNWSSGRPELFDRMNQLRAVWLAYGAPSFQNNVDYRYDYRRDGDRVLGRLDALSLRTSILPHPYIGSPYARALLVGDCGSDPRGPTTDLAFFGTTDASGYLNHALERAGLREYDLAFVNSYSYNANGQGDGANTEIVRFNAEGKRWQVVALGLQAYRRLKNNGIYIDWTIPHPQWWRRFHHYKLEEYAMLLKKAVHGEPLHG